MLLMLASELSTKQNSMTLVAVTSATGAAYLLWSFRAALLHYVDVLIATVRYAGEPNRRNAYLEGNFK